MRSLAVPGLSLALLLGHPAASLAQCVEPSEGEEAALTALTLSLANQAISEAEFVTRYTEISPQDCHAVDVSEDAVAERRRNSAEE
jgi:hypothetical protein